MRRRYVRPVCAPAYSPRYVVRRSYYTPYAYRPYYYPSVGIGLGFGYRHGYAGRSHYGHRHGGRTIGRRR